MPCCCMNAFASLSADFTTPHFSADLPVWPLREFKRVLFQPYEGETPLDMALREGNEEIVNLLKR